MIEGDSVVYEFTYPHAPERVWRSLVDPAELAQWLMPTRNYSLRPGDHFVMECDPIGPVDVEVVEVDPPRRLVWRWIASFGPTTVTFHVSAEGIGTRLRLEHDGWGDATDSRDEFNTGWKAKMGDGLRLVLDANVRPPDPTPR